MVGMFWCANNFNEDYIINWDTSNIDIDNMFYM